MSGAAASPRPTLLELAVTGPVQPWIDIGCTPSTGDNSITALVIGTTTLVFPDDSAPPSIRSWATSPYLDEVDGLRSHWPLETPAAVPAPASGAISAHANGAVALDHVVVFTPDLDRTDSALAQVGFDRRRRRDASSDGLSRWQSFYRMGEVVLEVVGPSPAEEPTAAPATFWGLVIVTDRLDEAIARADGRIGDARTAVQPGRRIATVRSSAGLGVPVAFMDPEP